jgi:hypothetical protein
MVLQNADVEVTDDPLLETRPEIRSARRQDNLFLGGLLQRILDLRVKRMILYNIWQIGVSALKARRCCYYYDISVALRDSANP